MLKYSTKSILLLVCCSLSIERKHSWYRFVARPSAGHRSVSVQKAHCGKTGEWIQMPLGVVSGVSQGKGVLDGGSYCQRGRGSFGGEFGASHCNVTNGDILL